MLRDKPEEHVVADSYSVTDDQYHFYRDGRPIPDIFFMADAVLGINVETDDYERDSKPVRYRLH